jgi:hypothetical protein
MVHYFMSQHKIARSLIGDFPLAYDTAELYDFMATVRRRYMPEPHIKGCFL